MKIQNKITNDLKEIKSSFENNVVKSNLISALQEIVKISKEKEYVVEGSIDKVIFDINLENSTLTSRKKIAKKVYYFQKKNSLKTMSALLSFIRKRFLGEEYRVSIRPSILEQEITALRERYKNILKEIDVTRSELKEKKKLLKNFSS